MDEKLKLLAPGFRCALIPVPVVQKLTEELMVQSEKEELPLGSDCPHHDKCVADIDKGRKADCLVCHEKAKHQRKDCKCKKVKR